MKRIVVVGNGISGLTACDSLRSGGFDGELTVVGAEAHQPYSRPALSKALLHGDGELDAHRLPEPTHEAAVLLGVSAVALDSQARVVTLDGGDGLPYDGLVIASGSRARWLGGAPGGERVHHGAELTLRTLEDALELRRRVAERPSVVVVGGGPLGMEVASGCLHAGCEVTLVSDGAPLARQLGEHLSGVFTAAALRKGLRIVEGGRARLVESATGPRVALPDGREIAADLVVTAAGDEPNVGWLAGSGLLLDGALRVDSRGRVRPEIVAAGDVAHFPTGHGLARVPLWTSAIDQAKTAALGLLLGDAAPALDFEPYFWTEGFGLSLKAIGRTPVAGAPDVSEAGPGEDSWLLRWDGERSGGHRDGPGTAAALNYRIPVPKLRRLAREGRAAGVGRAPQPA